MYQFLLLDMDDTILDFKKAEEVALRKTLEEFGLTPTPEVCTNYSRINQGFWEMLERKETTREELKVKRFEKLFEVYGITIDSNACSDRYVENLSIGHYFLPGAEEAVRRLSEKYKLYMVSNGNTEVQLSRIASSGMEKYFQKIFISGQVGVDKPDKVFFDRCFAQIPEINLEKTMIVGDSLTSDIQGGINAGIATCWVNPGHKPQTVPADYEIESLAQLPELLETL